MVNKYPGETRWQLRDDVVFIEAYDMKPKTHIKVRLPKVLPGAHIIDHVDDTNQTKWNVTLLSDFDAFIMRFIALGVDTDKHLPDIVASEYGINMSTEEGRRLVEDNIKKVLAQMHEKEYLQPRPITTYTQAVGEVPVDKADFERYLAGDKRYKIEAGIQSGGSTIIRVRRP